MNWFCLSTEISVKMPSQLLSASLASVLFLSPCLAAPTLKRSETGPHTSTDFPDPSIIHYDSVWHAFGTQSVYDNTDIHVQMASSTDFNDWTLLQGQDAMPTLPSWVNASSPEVWAPDVIKIVSPKAATLLFYIYN